VLIIVIIRTDTIRNPGGQQITVILFQFVDRKFKRSIISIISESYPNHQAGQQCYEGGSIQSIHLCLLQKKEESPSPVTHLRIWICTKHSKSRQRSIFSEPDVSIIFANSIDDFFDIISTNHSQIPANY